MLIAKAEAASEEIQTVFVVGAGASMDFAFPDGNGLVQDIESLASDTARNLGRRGASAAHMALAHQVFDTKRKWSDSISGEDWSEFIELFKDISARLWLSPSIDQFLAENEKTDPRIVPVAKFLIAECIAKYEGLGRKPIINPRNPKENDLRFSLSRWGEGDSYNFLSKAIDNSAVRAGWLYHLFRGLQKNCGSLEDFANRLPQIKIVTFNYDRCIEFFLVKALAKYHKVDEETASKVLDQLEVHHTYGSLGRLSKSTSLDIDEVCHDFGCPLKTRESKAVEVSNNIETMRLEAPIDENAHGWIQQAKNVVFIGFSFDEINVRRLGFLENEVYRSRNARIKPYATTIGWTEPSADRIKNHYLKTGRVNLSGNIIPWSYDLVGVNGKGAELFRLYGDEFLKWD